MKHLTVSILIFFVAITSIAYAQSTPQQMVSSMGRGINLGNVLSAPVEGNWSPAVEETFFEDVAASGFQTVRIPIRWDFHTTPFNAVTYTDGNNNYTGSPADYVVDSSFLDRVEQVTDWALNNGLVAIIDVHGDHWFWESYDSGSPEYKTGNDLLASEDRFRAIWLAISQRFQNKHENLLFEIMNEAYFSMSAPEVNYINQEILDIIRLTNPTRNVIINGGGVNSWEAPLQIPASFIQSDNYLIATFHYYKPGSFTRSAGENQTDNDWGTASDKQSVDAHFDAVETWSQNNNIPVFLGEFGADNVCGYDYENEVCGNFGGPDEVSRYVYHQYVAEAAVNRGFSLAVWDAGFKAGKTIYRSDIRKWVVDIRNAVLGIACPVSGIISNPDIECGYEMDWDLFVQTPAVATNTDATLGESKDGKITMQVDVTTAGGSFNKTILNNIVVADASLSGKSLSFSCFAKASTNTQQFKFRLKAIVNGATELTASPTFNLNDTAYQQYQFQYTVPQNISSLQLQILCGKQAGVYYFDDFQMEDQTLSIVENPINAANFKVYPNPVGGNNILHLESDEQIERVLLFNVQGQNIQIHIENNSISLPQLNKGLYFLKAYMQDGSILTKKIINN
ncbi:cellulase family glycosylhydrolase [Lacinutrix chionoecetis]